MTVGASPEFNAWVQQRLKQQRKLIDTIPGILRRLGSIETKLDQVVAMGFHRQQMRTQEECLVVKAMDLAQVHIDLTYELCTPNVSGEYQVSPALLAIAVSAASFYARDALTAATLVARLRSGQ